MKVYALVDLKGHGIVSIFQSVSDESAERSFLKLLTDGMPIVSDFPEDFAVFPVGELTVENAALKVAAMGNENLSAAGFKVDTYTVVEPVKRGSDYDRRFLRMVAEDRANVLYKPFIEAVDQMFDRQTKDSYWINENSDEVGGVDVGSASDCWYSFIKPELIKKFKGVKTDG